ncbi:hypothetical protein [Streptosporangium sp. NPDC002721]
MTEHPHPAPGAATALARPAPFDTAATATALARPARLRTAITTPGRPA